MKWMVVIWISMAVSLYTGIAAEEDDLCRTNYLLTVFGKCLSDNGGNSVVIHDLLHKSRSTTQSGKCFRACILTECKYLDNDNKFASTLPQSLAAILSAGNEDRVKPIEDAASNCISKSDSSNDTCDIAEDFINCFRNEVQVPLKADLLENNYYFK